MENIKGEVDNHNGSKLTVETHPKVDFYLDQAIENQESTVFQQNDLLFCIRIKSNHEQQQYHQSSYIIPPKVAMNPSMAQPIGPKIK